MCNRLGRKKLEEKGMLGRRTGIRPVMRHIGKHKAVPCWPRPDFTLLLHEKMIRVPQRPLFFNYMTRILNDHCKLRGRMWSHDEPEGYRAATKPAKLAHYRKLELYYSRVGNGRRVMDYSYEGTKRRRAKLAAQGITVSPRPALGNADFDGDCLNTHLLGDVETLAPIGVDYDDKGLYIQRSGEETLRIARSEGEPVVEYLESASTIDERVEGSPKAEVGLGPKLTSSIGGICVSYDYVKFPDEDSK